MTSKAKENAARYALSFIEPGMVVGLGTGSTAELFIDALGTEFTKGLDVTAVVTSKRSADQAENLGIPLRHLGEVDGVDVTVDGADEADAALNLIKGGGGALLWEKIVAQSSRFHVTIVDEAKMKARLGAFHLPVEIVTFGADRTVGLLSELLSDLLGRDVPVHMRGLEAGDPFITDEGHFIADCACQEIPDPPFLGSALNDLAGVVEHGLFCGLTDRVVIGGEDKVDVLVLPDGKARRRQA